MSLDLLLLFGTRLLGLPSPLGVVPLSIARTLMLGLMGEELLPANRGSVRAWH